MQKSKRAEIAIGIGNCVSGPTIDKLVKSQNHPYSSFPRKRESRKLNHFWTPAFAGVTALETLYETINH